jgi:hypothetical protein
MLVKTSKLTGAGLDWAVAKCEGALGHYVQPNEKRGTTKWEIVPSTRRYSTDWSQGGHIIDREKIETVYRITDHTGAGYWQAANLFTDTHGYIGPTPLIAAMRCYVASKFGEAVEIPDQLL